VAVALGATVLGCLPVAAWAAQDDGTEGGPSADGADAVDVIEVSGLIDPVVVDFVGDRLDGAARDGTGVVVIVLDSAGVVVDGVELAALAERVSSAAVPVAVWVGPSGSRAVNGAEALVVAADFSGMAPRSRLGVPGPARQTVGVDEAVRRGMVDVQAPVVGDFIVALDGRTLDGRTLDVAEVIGEGEDRRLQPQDVRFFKLPLVAQLMHTVASPPVAYLLLTAALALLVFELFTAGVGVAGLTGAAALVLAAYGLDVLPVEPEGLALIAVGTFGFAVDVQTGVPRVWTAVGTVAFASGSLLLFDAPGVHLSWVPLAGGIVGMVLMMLGGLPAVVRSRFSTPTIGRESIVGELGEAVASVSPDGVVRVRDALWPARTNRATPIGPGDPVRVVGVEGTRLEVEPEEGGARDYRH